MDPASTQKGNDPERWEKLLATLDAKLQLGLLEHVRRVQSYHFEADVLHLEPVNAQEAEYLKKSAVKYQLEILAQDAIGVAAVTIEPVRS